MKSLPATTSAGGRLAGGPRGVTWTRWRVGGCGTGTRPASPAAGGGAVAGGAGTDGAGCTKAAGVDSGVAGAGSARKAAGSGAGARKESAGADPGKARSGADPGKARSGADSDKARPGADSAEEGTVGAGSAWAAAIQSTMPLMVLTRASCSTADSMAPSASCGSPIRSASAPMISTRLMESTERSASRSSPASSISCG